MTLLILIWQHSKNNQYIPKKNCDFALIYAFLQKVSHFLAVEIEKIKQYCLEN